MYDKRMKQQSNGSRSHLNNKTCGLATWTREKQCGDSQGWPREPANSRKLDRNTTIYIQLAVPMQKFSHATITRQQELAYHSNKVCIVLLFFCSLAAFVSLFTTSITDEYLTEWTGTRECRLRFLNSQSPSIAATQFVWRGNVVNPPSFLRYNLPAQIHRKTNKQGNVNYCCQPTLARISTTQ